MADADVPGGLLVDDPADDKTDEADDARAVAEETGAVADDAAIVGELGGWEVLFLCAWDEHPAATTATAVRATKIRNG